MRNFIKIGEVEEKSTLPDFRQSEKMSELLEFPKEIFFFEDGDWELSRNFGAFLTKKITESQPVISVYGCYEAPVHRDGVSWDYTLGLVLHGNHVGVTGKNKRPALCLQRGVVYLLHNKSLHGACPVKEEKDEPLVFLTIDFVAESMRDGYGKIVGIQKRIDIP